MFKLLLSFSVLFLLVGCGTKPSMVQTHTKPQPAKIKKPIISVKKTPVVIQPITIEPIVAAVESDLLNTSNSKSYVTTFKTKRFAFSDAGFMRVEDNLIDLQILALGKPLLKMKISEDVCVDHHCRTKQEFNENFLSSDYPYELINNVLTSQPIFGGENIKQTTNGFMQRIRSPYYDIKYKVAPGSIYFKDLQNKIIIKMREIH